MAYRRWESPAGYLDFRGNRKKSNSQAHENEHEPQGEVAAEMQFLEALLNLALKGI